MLYNLIGDKLAYFVNNKINKAEKKFFFIYNQDNIK